MNHNLNGQMQTLAEKARAAAQVLAVAATEEKNNALFAMAKAIRATSAKILAANREDLASLDQAKAAFVDRLTLNETRIEAMAQGLEAIATLPDPVGKVLATFQRPNGLLIKRVSVPIGVIAVIYESRPNVTADAAGLCLKSGNAVILRGGSESFHSSLAIYQALQTALAETTIPIDAIQMVPTPSRDAIQALLTFDHYIDVVVPRGGPSLIQSIAAQTKIPLFKHLAGLCHTYVHESADLTMAKKIILNAKMRRTGICGATEVLLIDRSILNSHLPSLINTLYDAGCEIRGDEQVVAIDRRVLPATSKDFDTEFLAPIIAVKVVKDLQAAMAHIAQHGTQHTDAIIASDEDAAKVFLNSVDSAIVMHNTSTQFADGGEFGMGAEIGIATGKLHARGPIGVEQLTTFKYQVHGDGQVRT